MRTFSDERMAKLYEKLGNDKKSKEYYEKANEIEEYMKDILGEE